MRTLSGRRAGRSLEGRRIDLLTLTGTDGQQSTTESSLPAPILPEGGPRPHRFKNKRVVLVSARVHPGETPASHVVDGLLEFLLRRDDPRAISRTISAAHPATRFEGLASANYAVAVIHDANSNKKLDTMMGIPREGFGFSRNPTITFGPPKFTSASFPLDGTKQQVKMKYML